MQMTFTTSFEGVPILFERWTPRTMTAFAGSLIAIFASALTMRALLYVQCYLFERKQRAWALVRMLLAFCIAVLSYGLMLIAMTYVAVDLFAIDDLTLGLLFRNLRWLGCR